MEKAKRDHVRSWLLKAAHDLSAARLLARSEQSILDMAIYHCQQAAEKALKGFLVYWDRHVEKTHLLGMLLEKAAEIEPCFITWEDAADRLTPYASAYPYPGTVQDPDVEEVDEALDDAASIVNQVLALLPAEVHPDSAD
jgi:HEPN domain-containing protein